MPATLFFNWILVSIKTRYFYLNEKSRKACINVCIKRWSNSEFQYNFCNLFVWYMLLFHIDDSQMLPILLISKHDNFILSSYRIFISSIFECTSKMFRVELCLWNFRKKIIINLFKTVIFLQYRKVINVRQKIRL